MTKRAKIIWASVAGLAIAAVVAVCLLCCGKNDDYCSVVPKSAVALWRIDTQSVLDKNGIDEQYIIDRLDLDEDDAADLKEFLACGVDFMSPCYAYVDENYAMGAVFKMRSEKALLKALDDWREDVRKSGSVYFIDCEDDNMSICFDDEKLLFCFDLAGTVDESAVEKLMRQKKDESVMETKIYAQVMDATEPISSSISMKGLMRAIGNMSARVGQSDVASFVAMSAMVPDYNLIQTCDIDGGSLHSDIDCVANSDEAQAQLDKMMISGTLKGDLAELGIENPVVWFGWNLSGKKYLENLKTMPLWGMLSQEVTGVDVEGLLSSIEGDEVLAMGVKNGQPLVHFMAEANPDFFGRIEALINDFDLGGLLRKTSGENEYVLPLDGLSPVQDYDDEQPMGGAASCTFGMKGNVFYVGGSDARGLVSNRVSSMKKYESEIKESSIFGVVDFVSIVALVKDIDPSADLDLLGNFGTLKFKSKGYHAELDWDMGNGTKFFDNIFAVIKQIEE